MAWNLVLLTAESEGSKSVTHPPILEIERSSK